MQTKYIPGYGRFAQFITKRLADKNRYSFKSNISKIINHIPLKEVLEIDVVSFSGNTSIDDQLYSLTSFYYNVGVPGSWVIYSDNTHSKADIELLERFKNLKVIPWNLNLEKKYNELIVFGEKSVWGNRMHSYLNHPLSRTTIFTDSDIVFYNNFRNHLPSIISGNWFIADTGPNFDRYYFDHIEVLAPPYVNAGFLILNTSPDWESAIRYIYNRKDHDSWEHFTEQTAIHCMLSKDKTARPLDPSKFILSASDSFKLRIDYNINDIALRHYVSPVRHKMWQTPWQNVLKA